MLEAQINGEVVAADEREREERITFLRGEEGDLVDRRRELAESGALDDREVIRLQDEYDALDAAVQEADRDLICEFAGDCNTEPGYGPAYEERRRYFERLLAERELVRARLEIATAEARRQEENVERPEVRFVDDRLTTVRAELEELRLPGVPSGDEAAVVPDPTGRFGVLLGLLVSGNGAVIVSLVLSFLLLALVLTSPIWIRLLGDPLRAEGRGSESTSPA